MPASALSKMAPRAADIVGFSDEEIVQFMKASRGADGNFKLECAGWDELEGDQLHSLRERLMFGATQANEEDTSRPVNFDLVRAKLLALSDPDASDDSPASPDASASAKEPGHSPTPPPIPEEVKVRWDYDDLLQEGGRPAYPISDFASVSQRPNDYRGVIDGWQPDYVIGWLMPDVFAAQLRAWRAFRHWQKDNREKLGTDEEGFAQYLGERKTYYKRNFIEPWLPEFEAKIEGYRQDWERHILPEREENMRAMREDEGEGGFAEYQAEVCRHLADLELNHDFRLELDPSRQDNLATWIEYLHFEYVNQLCCRSLFEGRQKWYGKLKDELLNSEVVRPDEDVESFRSLASGMQEADEVSQAERATEAAQTYLDGLLDDSAVVWPAPPTPQDKESMIEEARAELRRVTDEYERCKKRMETVARFVRRTSTWFDAKLALERQECRVKWILSQVPLVEAEMAAAEGEGGNALREGDEAHASPSLGAEKHARSVVDDDGGVEDGAAGHQGRKRSREGTPADFENVVAGIEAASPASRGKRPSSADGDDDSASDHGRKRLKIETPVKAAPSTPAGELLPADKSAPTTAAATSVSDERAAGAITADHPEAGGDIEVTTRDDDGKPLLAEGTAVASPSKSTAAAQFPGGSPSGGAQSSGQSEEARRPEAAAVVASVAAVEQAA